MPGTDGAKMWIAFFVVETASLRLSGLHAIAVTVASTFSTCNVFVPSFAFQTRTSPGDQQLIITGRNDRLAITQKAYARNDCLRRMLRKRFH